MFRVSVLLRRHHHGAVAIAPSAPSTAPRSPNFSHYVILQALADRALALAVSPDDAAAIANVTADHTALALKSLKHLHIHREEALRRCFGILSQNAPRMSSSRVIAALYSISVMLPPKAVRHYDQSVMQQAVAPDIAQFVAAAFPDWVRKAMLDERRRNKISDPNEKLPLVSHGAESARGDLGGKKASFSIVECLNLLHAVALNGRFVSESFRRNLYIVACLAVASVNNASTLSILHDVCSLGLRADEAIDIELYQTLVNCLMKRLRNVRDAHGADDPKNIPRSALASRRALEEFADYQDGVLFVAVHRIGQSSTIDPRYKQGLVRALEPRLLQILSRFREHYATHGVTTTVESKTPRRNRHYGGSARLSDAVEDKNAAATTTLLLALARCGMHNTPVFRNAFEFVCLVGAQLSLRQRVLVLFALIHNNSNVSFTQIASDFDARPPPFDRTKDDREGQTPAGAPARIVAAEMLTETGLFVMARRWLLDRTFAAAAPPSPSATGSPAATAIDGAKSVASVLDEAVANGSLDSVTVSYLEKVVLFVTTRVTARLAAAEAAVASSIQGADRRAAARARANVSLTGFSGGAAGAMRGVDNRAAASGNGGGGTTTEQQRHPEVAHYMRTVVALRRDSAHLAAIGDHATSVLERLAERPVYHEMRAQQQRNEGTKKAGISGRGATGHSKEGGEVDASTVTASARAHHLFLTRAKRSSTTAPVPESSSHHENDSLYHAPHDQRVPNYNEERSSGPGQQQQDDAEAIAAARRAVVDPKAAPADVVQSICVFIRAGRHLSLKGREALQREVRDIMLSVFDRARRGGSFWPDVPTATLVTFFQVLTRVNLGRLLPYFEVLNQLLPAAVPNRSAIAAASSGARLGRTLTAAEAVVVLEGLARLELRRHRGYLMPLCDQIAGQISQLDASQRVAVVSALAHLDWPHPAALDAALGLSSSSPDAAPVRAAEAEVTPLMCEQKGSTAASLQAAHFIVGCAAAGIPDRAARDVAAAVAVIRRAAGVQIPGQRGNFKWELRQGKVLHALPLALAACGVYDLPTYEVVLRSTLQPATTPRFGNYNSMLFWCHGLMNDGFLPPAVVRLYTASLVRGVRNQFTTKLAMHEVGASRVNSLAIEQLAAVLCALYPPNEIRASMALAVASVNTAGSGAANADVEPLPGDWPAVPPQSPVSATTGSIGSLDGHVDDVAAADASAPYARCGPGPAVEDPDYVAPACALRAPLVRLDDAHATAVASGYAPSSSTPSPLPLQTSIADSSGASGGGGGAPGWSHLLELLDLNKLTTEPVDWLAGVYVFSRLLHPAVLNLEADPTLARNVRATLVRLGHVLPGMVRDVSRSDDIACALLLLRQCADRIKQAEEVLLSEAALGGPGSGAAAVSVGALPGTAAQTMEQNNNAQYDPFLDGPVPPPTAVEAHNSNVDLVEPASSSPARQRLSWTHPRLATTTGAANVTGSSDNAYEGSPLAAAKALVDEFATRLVHEAGSRLYLRETALVADVRSEAGEPFAPLTVLGVRFLCLAVRLNPTSVLSDTEGHAGGEEGDQSSSGDLSGILASAATQPLLHDGASLDVIVAVIARATARIDAAVLNPFEAATCARALSTLTTTAFGLQLLSPLAGDAVAEALDRFATAVRGARSAGAVHPAHRWLCDSIGMESLHASVPQEASIFSL